MAAYVMVRVNVLDVNKYKEYLAVAPKIIEQYGGKYLARAGETATLEGPNETRRIAILEFPSIDKAKEFYYSIEYQEARKLRKDIAIAEMIVVDGFKM